MLGGISFAYPFIIKAYKFGLSTETIGKLCGSLEAIIVRNRLIGTRADVNSRFNQVFIEFTSLNRSIDLIVSLVERMKLTTDYWWAYWNNDELRRSLQGHINRNIAKFLLWKYEGHLGNPDYPQIRFEDFKGRELEHIAPTTEPKAPNENDYDIYDEEFRQRYLECFGNYLLLSKSDNCSVGNSAFSVKRKIYTRLEQHREVDAMVKNGKWDRTMIKVRKDKIIEYLMGAF